MPGRRMQSPKWTGSRAITHTETLRVAREAVRGGSVRSALCCETQLESVSRTGWATPGNFQLSTTFLAMPAGRRPDCASRPPWQVQTRVGPTFLAARLISPLFFPPVRPISAGERFRALAALEALCGACFGGGEADERPLCLSRTAARNRPAPAAQRPATSLLR